MNKTLSSILLIWGLMTSAPLWAAESVGESGIGGYLQIQEPFTINFANQSDKKVRYLQIKVALKSHDPLIITGAEQNLPMIQDALRILFTDQTYESVSTVAGRQQLQQAALEKLRALLAAETGSNGLEQVYFTRFILQ